MTKEKKGFTIPAWIRLLFSALILAFLFYQVDFTSFWGMLAKAKMWWLLIGAALILSEPLILSYWWSGMLSAKGYTTNTFSVLRISLVSDFLGFVMPTSLGSDLVKVAGLSKYISNITEALSSLLVFRILNYGVMFIMALLTVLVFPSYFPDRSAMDIIRYSLIAGFVIVVISIFFARDGLRLVKWLFTKFNAPGIYEKLKKFYDALRYFKSNPVELAKAFIAGMIIQFERILFMYVVGRALGIDVGLVPFFVFVPIVTAITMLPVSISGIGVREGGYVLLFGYLDVSAGEALSLSIIGFAMNFMTVFTGGFIYWVSGFPAPDKLEELKSGSLEGIEDSSG